MTATTANFEPLQNGKDVANLVRRAIAAADLKNKGARFDPFILKVATSDQFDYIWGSANGDEHVDFYRFKAPADPKFLPLGDMAMARRGTLDQFGALLIASDDEGALAHPTGFSWILNDNGSQQDTTINYWWPIAPAGYTALGLCFMVSQSKTQPNPANYWCVRNDLVQTAPSLSGYWSDRNTHWTKNGSLRKAELTSDMRPVNDTVLIIPTTVLSAQGGQQGSVLVASQCLLDIDASYPQEPDYDPHAASGARKSEGLLKIAVLPYTAVSDPGRKDQALASPFYYAANQGFWECRGSYSALAGGNVTTSLHVGTESSVSKTFKEKTSLTIDVNVGLTAEGFSAGINTSFTQTFEYSSQRTDDNSTDLTTTVTINLPTAPVVWLWQYFGDVAVYSEGGMLVSNAIYGTTDNRLIAAPAAKPQTAAAKGKSLSGAVN